MTSEDLLALAAQLVRAAGTDVGDRLYWPGDWPSQEEQYPLARLRCAVEVRQQINGRNGPAEFFTTATLAFRVETSAAMRFDQSGARAAEAQLWAIKRQLERALINAAPLAARVQQIKGTRARLVFHGDAATHLAGLDLEIDCEFFEGADQFAPVAAIDIDGIAVTPTHYPR